MYGLPLFFIIFASYRQKDLRYLTFVLIFYEETFTFLFDSPCLGRSFSAEHRNRSKRSCKHAAGLEPRQYTRQQFG